MKTSLFDMNFTLPPLVEMTQVVKEMPMSASWLGWTGLWLFLPAVLPPLEISRRMLLKKSIFDMR